MPLDVCKLEMPCDGCELRSTCEALCDEYLGKAVGDRADEAHDKEGDDAPE